MVGSHSRSITGDHDGSTSGAIKSSAGGGEGLGGKPQERAYRKWMRPWGGPSRGRTGGGSSSSRNADHLALLGHHAEEGGGDGYVSDHAQERHRIKYNAVNKKKAYGTLPSGDDAPDGGEGGSVGGGYLSDDDSRTAAYAVSETVSSGARGSLRAFFHV